MLVDAAHIVTVTNQNDYQACGGPIVLDISGELAFTNGNKLELPCGSLVSIQAGGAVYKASAGGGSSTLISICNSNIWTAADGRLDGPTSFGGFVLPVELIHFEVSRLNDDEVSISWSTASEVNSDYFTLSNGEKGDEWDVVRVLPAAGFSNALRGYEVIVAEQELRGSVFKLEQTDFDGSVDVLGHVVLKEGLTAPEAIVWPNPAISAVRVDLSPYTGGVELLLMNMAGQSIHAWRMEDNPGIATIDLAALNLEDGLYLLQIASATRSDVVRLELSGH